MGTYVPPTFKKKIFKKKIEKKHAQSLGRVKLLKKKRRLREERETESPRNKRESRNPRLTIKDVDGPTVDRRFTPTADNNLKL